MFTKEQFIEAKRVGAPYAGNAGSEKTLSSYFHALARAEKLLGKALTDMTVEDAGPLMRSLDSFAASTKNQTLSALNSCFKWAIGNGLYSGSQPFGGVANQRGPQRIPVILDDASIQRFFEAFDDDKYRLLFKTMFYGALRIGEVVTLKSDQILENGLLIHGKGAKDRFVPLISSILSELRAIAPENGPIFVGRDKNKSISTFPVYVAFEKARKKANLDENFVPHNLRATCATKFNESTRDLAATQAFLGHASPQTTMRYVALSNHVLAERYASVFSTLSESA